MREFNTSGPCNPELHYTVPRTDVVARGLEHIERGHYFTMFAPRQAGKTTCFQLMLKALEEREGYVGTWISVEHVRNAPPEVFWDEVRTQLVHEFGAAAPGFELPPLRHTWDIGKVAAAVHELGRRWVLIIDEFEGTPENIIGELMHQFRFLYHRKDSHALHSLALVGVRNITEVNLDHASPFNIADEIQIPYFSEAEVRDLIGQYVEESGQAFDESVIRQVYANTAGQPGLACALCRDLVERFATDRSQPVTLDAFWPMLQYYLTEKIDKNVSNIVSKARQQPDLMLRVLFNGDVPFRVQDPAMSFLQVNGVVASTDGVADVPVPLYKKCLISALQPMINGETEHYTTVRTDFDAYLDGEGLLRQPRIQEGEASTRGISEIGGAGAGILRGLQQQARGGRRPVRGRDDRWQAGTDVRHPYEPRTGLGIGRGGVRLSLWTGNPHAEPR